MTNVNVLIGAGSIGQAIARRVSADLRIEGPHETARFPIALGRRAWPLPKDANLLDGRREYARKRRNGKTYRKSRYPSGGPA